MLSDLPIQSTSYMRSFRKRKEFMRQTADGIAHVSFPGGGTFLPARTPYDRQILLEYVGAYLHANGQVQVLVDGQRWMVHLTRNSAVPSCSTCGCSADSVCSSLAHGEEVYCVKCALGGCCQTALHQHEEQQRAGNAA
jgi:hypothetical protein